MIHGNVFKLSPLPRKKYRKSVIHNTLALLRLFVVNPIAGIGVTLEWKNETLYCKSGTDGFFSFNWKDKPPLPCGWNRVVIKAWKHQEAIAEAVGTVFVPHSTQYAFISDIDDTFLISHSSNLRKRLSVLFTRNARTRKPFADVVRHYQLLATAQTTPEQPNPFFYVSSSEWNLYDYIMEFITINKLPNGVLLLNTMKHLS